MGSWHGPNLEAAERVLAVAPAFDHVIFVIVGSAGLYFRNDRTRTIPENVKLVGPVDEKEKTVLLAAADVALNPMTSGSGSNLKMLDYFAAGVPVLSTEFGARGLAVEAGQHYWRCDADALGRDLLRFLVDPGEVESVVARASTLVRARFSWQTIARQALDVLRPLL